MIRKNAVALALAGAVILGGAAPLSAAVMSNTTSAKVTETHAAAGVRGRERGRSPRMQKSGSLRRRGSGTRAAAAAESPWYRSFGSAARDDNYAPGTWHINGDGMRYQVPYPCAYPIGADSGGAEMFQMYGCPLD